jgi:MFS family permease
VALPFQIYVLTNSVFLTGLLGLAELGPMILVGLLGGAWSDRMDRRKLLLWDQVALIGLAAALAVLAFIGDPPVWTLFVLGGLLAGAGTLQNTIRQAMVPNLVEPEVIRSAVAFSFAAMQLSLVVGPALGGLMIASLGVGSAYTLDAVTCLAMALAALMLPAQMPKGLVEGHPPVWQSIKDGLGFVGREKALMGSFGMDLVAMTFGMPRALFPALAITTFGSGAEGAGLLLTSVAVGATIGSLTSSWATHISRLGIVLAWAVIVWGLAIAVAGAAGSLWLACVLFAVAGVADSVSAVCRGSINQLVTPDHLRGRMSGVFSLVNTTGPRFGDIESGTAASLTSVRISVVSGGLACVVGVALIALMFPALMRFDAERAEKKLRESEDAFRASQEAAA